MSQSKKYIRNFMKRKVAPRTSRPLTPGSTQQGVVMPWSTLVELDEAVPDGGKTVEEVDPSIPIKIAENVNTREEEQEVEEEKDRYRIKDQDLTASDRPIVPEKVEDEAAPDGWKANRNGNLGISPGWKRVEKEDRTDCEGEQSEEEQEKLSMERGWLMLKN